MEIRRVFGETTKSCGVIEIFSLIFNVCMYVFRNPSNQDFSNTLKLNFSFLFFFLCEKRKTTKTKL